MTILFLNTHLSGILTALFGCNMAGLVPCETVTVLAHFLQGNLLAILSPSGQ